ncbi:MAG TPA: hypothetical protein VF384_02605 [Planctomycetota bacterium]
MKIRTATALLALMLPLAAQDPAAANEAIFYKAFYLEKGARDRENASVLYEQFLNAAPDHKLAKEAATLQYHLLGQMGKTKEQGAFKTKYEKLLGNVAPAPAAGDRGAGGGADAPRGGRGDGQGRAAGGGDMQARMAELEKQLAKAKEEGNDEEVKKLEDQIARMKQMAERGGRGGAGAGGPGGMGRGAFGVLRGNKKYSEMTDEEKTQLKDAVGMAQGMADRQRDNGNEDAAKKIETATADLKKALEGNKPEDIQKALDAVRAAMPARGGRGGGGGDAGGGGGNRGGGGGGGGNNGGGGGGNNGGGGGGR